MSEIEEMKLRMAKLRARRYTLSCGGCGLKFRESQRQEWAVHRSRCPEKWRKLKAGEPCGDRVE